MVDLAVVRRDACQKFGQLLGEGGVELGEFFRQLIPLGLEPVVDDLAPCVLLLILQLLEALTQFGDGGLQALAFESQVIH